MKTHIDQPRIQAKPARGDIRVTRKASPAMEKHQGLLVADGMGSLVESLDHSFAMEGYASIVDLFAAPPGSIGERAAQLLRQMRLAHVKQGA